MMEISQRLRTTHATVHYWLKRHGIPGRSWSESTYTKLNPHEDPFTIPAEYVNSLVRGQGQTELAKIVSGRGSGLLADGMSGSGHSVLTDEGDLVPAWGLPDRLRN